MVKAVNSGSFDAEVLQAKGIKCSVIYGSLPHDVRHIVPVPDRFADR